MGDVFTILVSLWIAVAAFVGGFLIGHLIFLWWTS